MKSYLINKRLKELCNEQGYLSNETNIILFQEYEQSKLNNTPKEDIDARTILILGNQKLIFFILNSKFELHPPFEDLEEFSVGQIGLIKAVDTYNINSGIKFITYACKVIMNEIRMHYRKLNTVSNYAEKSKIFLEEYIPDINQDGERLRIMDTLSAEDNFVEEVLDNEEVDRIIKNLKYLKQNEALAVIHFYGLFGNKAKSQGEIAEILKVNRSQVSRYLSNGVKKLKVLTLSAEDLISEERYLREQLLNKGKQNNIKSSWNGFK